VPSIEPGDGGYEVDRGEEVAGALVVAGRDRPVLLELGEEVPDQVAGLVEVPVVRAGVPAVGLGRDDGRLAGPRERPEHALLGVERLVRDHRVGPDPRQPRIGAFEVVRLSGREREPGRVARRVDRGVDLGRRAALAPADRLGREIPPLAPALC
jgi:hypothetical protein